jgi:predicted RND superfamily exporter protein
MSAGAAPPGPPRGEAALLGLVDRLVVRRRAVLAVAAVVALAALSGLPRLGSNNSPEVWFLEKSPEVETYRRFVERFGSDHGARVALDGEQLWSAEGLGFLAAVERRAAALSGVTGVSSIAAHHGPDTEEFPPADLAALRAAVVADPLDRAMGWVGDGGRVASVLVETGALGADAARELERALVELAAAAPPGVIATVAGTRSLDLAFDRSAAEIGRRYLPLLALAAIVLLAATFRDAAGVAVPLAFVAFVEAVVLGTMGWAGVEIHLVLAVLPPVLFVIALATAIHVLIPCRAREAAGESARQAVVAVYRDKGRALLWTGISTATGFASLALSNVPPVAQLGRWAAAGLAIQVISAFTVYPALVAAVAARRGLPERALEERLERLGRRLATAAARRRGAVLALYAGTAIAAALGLPRLERASDALRFLAPGDPTRRAIERLEGAGIGLATVELHLTAAPGAAGFDTPEGITTLAAASAALSREAGVLGAVGAGDLALDAARRSPFAALAAEAELPGQGLELLRGVAAGERALGRFLAVDGRQARLTLFVRHAGFEEIDGLAAGAVATVRGLAPPGTEVVATGVLPVLLALHRELLATLGLSLGATLPVLAAVFFGLLRRKRDVVRALVPNLWPIVVLLGGMGWAGVPLDVATVMVAAVVLGLVVDDTLHTLAHYRERRLEAGAFAAVADRIERTAPAYLLTGAILAGGFAVCALSDFEPIARFGALSAVAIAIAVVADLVLVPALFGRD